MGIGRGEQWISNRYPTLLARFSIVGSVLNSNCSSFAVAQFIPFLIDRVDLFFVAHTASLCRIRLISNNK